MRMRARVDMRTTDAATWHLKLLAVIAADETSNLLTTQLSMTRCCVCIARWLACAMIVLHVVYYANLRTKCITGVVSQHDSKHH